MRVLITDDSPLQRSILRNIIGEKIDRADILEASSGDEALKIVKEKYPELVFMDCIMPGIDGISTAKKIKGLENDIDYTPYIIMITSEEKLDAEALENGCDDFMKKPFSMEEIKARITVAERILKIYKKMKEQKKQLLEIAMVDPLTKIYNRRMLKDLFYGLIEDSKRKSRSLSLCICDVDKFKFINDTFGHTEGDRILKELSQAFRDSIRSNDIVGRFGGDEFLFIFPESGEYETRIICRRLKDFSQNVKLKNGKSVSISIGSYSAVPETMDSMDKYVKEADKKLYEEKAKKKNIEIYS